MAVERSADRTIKLHAEALTVGKRRVDRSRILVHKTVSEREQSVECDLETETADIERVPINAQINEAPGIRQQGDVTIIPLVEEVVVIERRLVLREKIRIRRRRAVQRMAQAVTLRSEAADITREPLAHPDPTEPTPTKESRS